MNERGDTNQRPIEHRIEVTPDLPPLVELLNPATRETTIPENGRLQIELRAVDPDFELDSLGITGVARGKEVFARELLDAPVPGQVLRDFVFRPNDLGLKAGDVAVVSIPM